MRKSIGKKLLALKMNNISLAFFEMLPLFGVNIAVAYSKFLALHDQLCFAAQLLIKAHETKDTWEKKMYLESSIVKYNGCRDNIYQILYFYFNIYTLFNKHPTITRRNDIITVSKQVHEDVMEQIKSWLTIIGYTNLCFFLADYENFTCKRLTFHANEIKHRGGFETDRTVFSRYSKVTKVINGVEINITEIVEPNVINIDAEVDYLIDVHKKLFDLQVQLVQICAFKERLHSFLSNPSAFNHGEHSQSVTK